VSLLVLLLLTLFAGIPGPSSSEGWTEYGPTESFSGRVFVLEDGDFVTYPPGEAKPGDKIVCVVDGKRVEGFVPRPGAGTSTDPIYIETKPNGEVRAECGGIHAGTAPPGSW
jgi:hypothetical protein